MGASVAQYLIGQERKTKQEKDQSILDWYKYTKGEKDKTSWYFIPHYGSDSYEEGNYITKLMEEKMCTQVLFKVMEITQTRMIAIQKAAMTTGVVKPHGNTGKSTAIKADDPRMPPLRGYFEELLKLGEVRVTRFTATLVDGMEGCTTQDNDNTNIYTRGKTRY